MHDGVTPRGELDEASFLKRVSPITHTTGLMIITGVMATGSGDKLRAIGSAIYSSDIDSLLRLLKAADTETRGEEFRFATAGGTDETVYAFFKYRLRSEHVGTALFNAALYNRTDIAIAVLSRYETDNNRDTLYAQMEAGQDAFNRMRVYGERYMSECRKRHAVDYSMPAWMFRLFRCYITTPA